MATRKDRGGRPSLFTDAKKRMVNITDQAMWKADADAKVLTTSTGKNVSTSQAIEAAIRAFDAREFKLEDG